MDSGANGGGSGDGVPEGLVRTVKSIVSGASESEICEALVESKMDPNDAALRLLSRLVHNQEASNQERSPPRGDPLSTDIGGETSGAVNVPQRPGVQSGVGKKGKKRNIPLFTVGSAIFGLRFSNPSPVSERPTQQSDNVADQQFNFDEWPQVGQRAAVTRSSAVDVSAAPDAESNSNQPGLCIDGSDVQVSEEGVGDIAKSTCDFSTGDATTNDSGETSHCDDKTVKDKSSHEPPEVPDTESNSNQPGLCIDDVQVSEEGVGRGDCGADLSESSRDSSARDVTNNAVETSHCDDDAVKDNSSHEPPEGIDSCIPSASAELERLSLGEENRVKSLKGKGVCEETSAQELQAFDARFSHLTLNTFKPDAALNPRIGESFGCSSAGGLGSRAERVTEFFCSACNETRDVGDYYSPRTGMISHGAFEATYVHGSHCPFLAPIADRALGDQPCSPLSVVPISTGFLESDVESLNDYDPRSPSGLVESSMSEVVRSGAPFRQRQQNQSYLYDRSYAGVGLHRSMSGMDQFQGGGASSSRSPVMSNANVFRPSESSPDIHGSFQRSLLSIAPAPIQDAGSIWSFDAGSREVPPVPAQNQQRPGYWQNNERAVQRPAAAPGYQDYHGPQEYQQQQHGIGQSSQHQRHAAPPGYVGFYLIRAEFWIAQPRFGGQSWQQRAAPPGGRGFYQPQGRGYQQRGRGNGQRSQHQRHAAPPGYVGFYQIWAEFWIAQPRFGGQSWQQPAAPPSGRGFYQPQGRGYQQRGRGNGQHSQQQ